MTNCYICGNHSSENTNILEGRAQHSGKMLKELIGKYILDSRKFLDKNCSKAKSNVTGCCMINVKKYEIVVN